MAEQEPLFDLKAADAAALLAREAPTEEQREVMRLCEAMIFAATEPLSEEEMLKRLPEGAELMKALAYLKAEYFARGVNLVRVGKKWMFRTAPDLAWVLQREQVEPKKLSRAAMETLAIIAYH
ncbi:SMC-Scp complex subunit ScpB, partial [Rhodoblastus sp.]|uniref:SMC-Scp complex subunit ScpB n=1 Tax=Rhodoblastus sp. TaxID=1962975 RepID=UPI00260EA4C3